MHRGRQCGCLVLCILFSMLSAPLARASCTSNKPFADAVTTANTVFVGTVVATTNAGRIAMVRVESVWRGLDLPTAVVVNGRDTGPGAPPDRPGSASSEDRHYTVGQRYLFLPRDFVRDGSPTFTDSPCTFTQPYSPDLDHYAPSTARTPDPLLATPPPFPPSTPPGVVPPWEIVAAGLLMVGLVAAVVLRIR